MKQSILPVLSTWKMVDTFLKHELTWCIIMDFHINLMDEIVEKLHAHQKKVIVHMDLIKGVQNDQYGTQYMCQRLHVDGIISTKPKAIEAAKANHCISILRAFLIDSRSLKRSVQLCNTLQPDYVEVLPAIIPNIVQRLHIDCDVNIIGGGLIQSKEDIQHCLASGMCAVTTSNMKLLEEDA